MRLIIAAVMLVFSVSSFAQMLVVNIYQPLPGGLPDFAGTADLWPANIPWFRKNHGPGIRGSLCFLNNLLTAANPAAIDQRLLKSLPRRGSGGMAIGK
jgi:hypothetical protein